VFRSFTYDVTSLHSETLVKLIDEMGRDSFQFCGVDSENFLKAFALLNDVFRAIGEGA